MKHLILITFLCVIYTSVSAQQLSKAVDFKLPQKVQKLSEKQIENLFLTDSVKNALLKNGMAYYALDSIQIGFRDYHATKDFQRPLENIKSGILEASYIGNHKNVKVDIKTFNDMRFLLYSYDDDGLSYIRFYSEYCNDLALSGLIRFNKVDAQRAVKILYEMLNTARFKD